MQLWPSSQPKKNRGETKQVRYLIEYQWKLGKEIEDASLQHRICQLRLPSPMSIGTPFIFCTQHSREIRNKNHFQSITLKSPWGSWLWLDNELQVKVPNEPSHIGERRICPQLQLVIRFLVNIFFTYFQVKIVKVWNSVFSIKLQLYK